MQDIYILSSVFVVCTTLAFICYFYFNSSSAVKVQEAKAKAELSALKSTYRLSNRLPESQDSIAPWVSELLTTLGVDEKLLFDEAGGEQFARFMPLIKGFLAMNPNILKQPANDDKQQENIGEGFI